MDISIEQESDTVDSYKWPTIDIIDLYKQKNILYTRLSYCQSINNKILTNSLHEALDNIEYFITLQNTHDEK